MNINVLCHSSIRIETDGRVIYSDPFRIKAETHDADIIMITHSHYDHFSEEDISKVANNQTKILVTEDLFDKILKLSFKEENITVVIPNETYSVLGYKIDTVAAYNIDKEFHPKKNNWVGYVIEIEGEKIYIAGDTDIIEENKLVTCDIALVPVGGTYTTTSKEAAELINIIKPKLAIPMHYAEIVGSREDAVIFKNMVNKDITVEIQI